MKNLDLKIHPRQWSHICQGAMDNMVNVDSLGCLSQNLIINSGRDSKEMLMSVLTPHIIDIHPGLRATTLYSKLEVLTLLS